MNPNAAKQLEDYINESTSESLSAPNTQLFIEICNLINSRSDLPKVGMVVIRKLLSSNSQKTLFLTLDLIEVAANVCEMPFFNQICSQEFMQTMSTLSSRSLDKVVFGKYVKVIKYLTQVLMPLKMTFPLLFKLYNYLESKGVVFPSIVESSYAYLKNSNQTDQFAIKKIPESSEQISKSKIDQPINQKNKAFNNKAQKDLDVVKENLDLINEIIDAHDPKEDVLKNDILTDLIQSIQETDKKLQDFISKIETDEDLLAFCIDLNDDLNLTLERYKSLKARQKPAPRKKVSAKKEIVKEFVEDASGPYVNDLKFADFSDFPKKTEFKPITNNTQETETNQSGSKHQTMKNIPAKKPVIDLLDLDYEETKPQPQQQPIPEIQNDKREPSNNIFSFYDPIPTPQSQQQMQPTNQQKASLPIESLPVNNQPPNSFNRTPTNAQRQGNWQGQGVNQWQDQEKIDSQSHQTPNPKQKKDYGNEHINSRLQALDDAFKTYNITSGNRYNAQYQGQRYNYDFMNSFGMPKQIGYGNQFTYGGSVNNEGPSTEYNNKFSTQPKPIEPIWGSFGEYVSPESQPGVNPGTFGGGAPITKSALDDLDNIFNAAPKQNEQDKSQKPGFIQQGSLGQQQDRTTNTPENTNYLNFNNSRS